MGALTPMHILVIVVAALLLFGPAKLPELGRGFGRMFREFKDATNGNSPSDESPRAIEAKPELTVSADAVQQTPNK
ncbi:Sec-independent protein translocase subunit TatA/TatB [Paenibacillus mucilaginosus]|uniref:Sec-independent protein translocase protein TatA n=4 Tax=Paenibacillus mucilaginosus TaxID=61624 RepID=H6NJ51_9BACL|nr:twin-arginine translocase TatA/TatE family subunit [Paenibacillus mucilaginosus]AEI40166.1 hypothetical protein KNP414_01602 [Paenibacillus mucilaginosus KNP414]AFC28813.1 hypothetical protein PM3016_1909 [Paenibacillus mucilaginosus 3016]AFH60989.1 TAT family twin arginine targeting transporter [Paenibacillus mucilaginosus K02]WDM29396.1 twin-arginine translocase TatA/TatE family subunit [Paenibacillus mucilaginosus]WFA17578.1 twin-arginine translocase TatA/TatE family subunit [Paenibacill